MTPPSMLLLLLSMLALGYSTRAARMQPEAATNLDRHHHRHDQWEPPKFCNGKDCPRFKVIQSGSSYDIRQYKDASWVLTNVSGIKFDHALKQANRRLDEYRKGHNTKGATLDDTTPVLALLRPVEKGRGFEATYTFAKYIPDELQDKPPVPESKELGLWVSPLHKKVFVKVFGGYANEDDITREAFDFMEELEKDGHKFNRDVIGFAQYDSVIKVLNRHNEILIDVGCPKPTAAATATATAVKAAGADVTGTTDSNTAVKVGAPLLSLTPAAKMDAVLLPGQQLAQALAQAVAQAVAGAAATAAAAAEASAAAVTTAIMAAADLEDDDDGDDEDAIVAAAAAVDDDDDDDDIAVTNDDDDVAADEDEEAGVADGEFERPLQSVNAANFHSISPATAWAVELARSLAKAAHTAMQVLRLPRSTLRCSDDFKPPAWYYGKDGPTFTIKKSTEEAELRVYPAARWLQTNVSNVTWAQAVTTGSARLDSYNSGNNQQGRKLASTAPGTFTLLYPTQEGRQLNALFSVEAFLPYEVQGDAAAPIPNDASVVVLEVPETEVWVKVFGGYASDDDIVKNAFDFLAYLIAQDIEVDHSAFAFAGYDPKVVPIARHNEIWWWVPSPAPTASTTRRSAWLP